MTDSAKLIYQSWSCRFCHEAFEYEIPAARHAAKCTHNPYNRTCDTCVNREVITKCRVRPDLDSEWQEYCEQWEIDPIVKLELEYEDE